MVIKAISQLTEPTRPHSPSEPHLPNQPLSYDGKQDAPDRCPSEDQAIYKTSLLAEPPLQA